MDGEAEAPKTTTISTIAVQSGSTRIVIALLQAKTSFYFTYEGLQEARQTTLEGSTRAHQTLFQPHPEGLLILFSHNLRQNVENPDGRVRSGDWLELRVVEMSPGLTLLGATLAEATQMLSTHEQVLEKIHSKQSPVEELLRQADQLVASQHTRAEVYAAMAESLSAAWQDVNILLQRRKEILQINVHYHSDAAVCLERTRALELACVGASLPVEVSELRDLLTRLSEVKRSMLEALMAALQNGRALLDILRQIANEGTVDSRPSQIKASTDASISQVERWLEDLHDRRRTLELSWQSRKTQLEQCLALALLTTDLRLLEEIFADRIDGLNRNSDELGDSESCAQLLLSEHKKLLPEAKELQEQGLKILRATEQLAATGHFAGEEAITKAYQLLNTSSEYLELLERREQNLNKAMVFFKSVQELLARLKNKEKELLTRLSPVGRDELSRLQEEVSENCEPVLRQGYEILEIVPGAKGVQNIVEELESLKLRLTLRCSDLQEENLKVTQALNNFLEKQNQLYSWLVSTSDSFLQRYQDMGSVLAVAKEFSQQHHRMLNELQIKGTEINAFLSTVPDLISSLDEGNRVDVESKAEALKDFWSTFKQILDKRTDLATLYVRFHSIVVDLANQLDSLTERLNSHPGESERRELEEQNFNVTQLFTQMDSVGDNFMQDSHKAEAEVEPHLSVERARLCVDSLRQHFADRVANLQTLWQQWEQRLDATRQTTQRWTLTMTDSNKTIDWVSKLDAQLYPVLSDSLSSAKAVIRDLEDKRDRVLTEIKRAQAEVQLRINTADEILSQDIQNRDEGVLKQLKNLQEKLQQIVTDYQVLLEMFISFFKNLSELEHTVQGMEGQFGLPTAPASLADVEKALREHDASRQAVQELFKFAHTESQQIINKIRQQEPEAAANKDVDSVRRMLESQRTAWERAWTQHRMSLESQQQLGQFDSDLLHIHNSLDELSQQLSKVKGQFGENLSSAKATSLAFHYFEKTIELLEQRIETFMGSGDTMLKSKHSSSPHIQQELIALRTRWHEFRQQVNDTRQLIDLSLQYFTLVEEAEDWFREGSRLLMLIAKKSSTIRTPQEANDLLEEIELFLKPGESRQEERIQKILLLSDKLYGGSQPAQLHQVKSESKEMIDSFSQVTLELQQIVNFLNKPLEEQQMEIVGLKETLPIEDAPHPKSPSPPPKKAKVEELEPEVQPPNFPLPLNDATIDEGSRFTFECKMSGYPVPQVSWLKDNMSIDSNLDYHTKVEDDGLCSLTIDETFTEDSACFTCRATNPLGFAETTALLTVRENERESPPVFVRQLASVISKEKSPCSLVCKVEGTPLPTVQWFKDNVCVDAAAEYVITYNNGEAVLSIEQLRTDNQGLYSCKATNRLGSDSTSANLTVESMVSEKAPVFVTPLSNVMARTGQKIKLECEVAGTPNPQIAWIHNGKPLPDTRDIKIQYDKGKVILTILEAFPKDAGTYSMQASNSAGTVSGTCTVSVKGRLPAETSDSELASDLEPTKPSVPMQLKDTVVVEGEKVRLDCIIVGQPEPEVIWYHEGKPVKESKEVQLQFQGDRCSLVIAETLPDDAGHYKIVAINSAGEASSSCQLVVQSESEGKNGVEPVCGTKPVFISLLTDALATEGDATTLECAVTGEPAPIVTWSLNNIAVQPSNRIKMEQEAGGLCTLMINPVSSEDKGVYTAKAINSAGEAKCFAHLIVKSAANLATSASSSDVRLEERGAVPAFTELFADREVFDGESTRFECIVTGKPTPKIRWLYNDEPVSGKDFLPSVSGSRQVLAIPVVSKTHGGGKITCTAENEVGKASCSAFLTVTEVPPVDELLATIDQLNLSKMSTFEMKREVTMQTSSHTKYTNGEPVVQVHGIASKTEQTSQKIGDEPAVQTESHKTSEYHSVDGMEQKVDTSVQSSTTETAGAGPVALFKPSQRKQAPPRFTSPVQGKIVDQGADVTLECIVEGVPSPSILWMKNGRELLDNDRVRIGWEHNKSQCKLQAVTADDTGKYTCTASNPTGTTSCTADLVVKKSVFPPVFGRRLRAETMLVGQRVVLEVEVTGTPDPTVTWFKDGQQIAASSSMFRVVAQGNSHRLVIEQASHSHSGRYEVRAFNSGGETKSIAELLIVEPPEMSAIQPTDLEKDILKSVDIASPKHTVSITESFKSDKKVSIHVERSTAPLDSLFEMSHLSVKTEEMPQTTLIEESKSVHTLEEKCKEEKVIGEEQMPNMFKPADVLYAPTLPEVTSEVESSNIVEDSSIAKKSALSFFRNIIEENKEEQKLAKLTEPTPKPYILEPLALLQMVSHPPLPFETSLPETSTFSQTSFQETSHNYESLYTSDGFFLQPEPPPEMGYIPKSQVINTREEMADRVKKLEESHRFLSLEQVPSGGVKIFPSPAPKSQLETPLFQKPFQEESFLEIQKPIQMEEKSTQSNNTLNALYSKIEEKSTLSNNTLNELHFPNLPAESTTNQPLEVLNYSQSNNTINELYFSNLPAESTTNQPLKTLNYSQNNIPNENSFLQQEKEFEAHRNFHFNSTNTEVFSEKVDFSKTDLLGPVVRPSADIQLRPQSPRPSAEGIHMEKMWTSKQKEEYVEFPHASPTPNNQSQESFPQFKAEKMSMCSETKRIASPLPSATGISMEKLWTPSAEYHQQALSAVPAGERPKSPSAEGLAMDKLWAHKTSSHKKVWPPPNSTEEVYIPPPWKSSVCESASHKTGNTSSEVISKMESFVDKHISLESESFSKIESSTLQTSSFTENILKKESAFKEVTPNSLVKSYIPPQNFPPQSKIIYVAETQASHSVNLPAVQPSLMTTETNISSFSQSEKTEQTFNDSYIIEEKVLRPSEAVKKWPPRSKEVMQEFSQSITKQGLQNNSFKLQPHKDVFPSRISNGTLNDIHLEPGPPPEIGFAEPPPRRQSYVEVIEQDLEKTIDKVPSKHLAGAVRIIPPPQKKEGAFLTENSFQSNNCVRTKEVYREEKPHLPDSISKPLPKMEPFPFKPDPPKSKPAKCPPPPRPSKFVKGSFTESDYESDCEAMKIPIKWNPWQSDSEDYNFRKVQPPSVVSPTKRPHSVTGHVLPPSDFEKPLPLLGPSKPVPVLPQPTEMVKSTKSKIIKSEESYHKTVSSQEIKSFQNKLLDLKPGSPPQFVEAPPPKHKPTTSKPGSPKSKQKTAHTAFPESGYMADTDEPKQFAVKAKTEESVMMRTEQTVTYEQSKSELKTLTSSSSITSNKETSKPVHQPFVQKKEEPPLEPFPFKPDPGRPAKRSIGPPPPSPSKFIKGEFRESDYESEYESKIRPLWRPNEPADDLSFRPVKPILTPVSGKTQNIGRTPTPPTEFDEPPSFNGPPRPKFEPIDKPKPTTMVKEVNMEKTKLIRPTPVQAQITSPIETIYATPASNTVPDFVLRPGSPPRMDYAPPPQPGFVEKSNIVNFTESTENTKRVVSVQQTTRVMQFGSSSQKQVKRKENVPPRHFVPAFSSDCESDVDGVVNMPKRTPYIDAEKKRLKRVEEMKRKFLESEPQLQPGEPPEFAYSPEPSQMAYSVASKQMSEMTESFKGKTQKFVSDIMTDLKTSQPKMNGEKPAVKPSENEPQTYRDESRISEFGKKQIDPETGLIYFKYDFGYEFGIVLPGEEKPGAPRKVFTGPSKKEEGAIDFPIIHEKSQTRKATKLKSVKWEPTSESEMSEIESERVHKGLPIARFRLRTPSPSPSPSVQSLQSLSPYPAVSSGSPWLNPDSNKVVRAVSPGEVIKKAPLFITPLRDIACVSGQPARFECIVLAEPVPSVSWYKDGLELLPSSEHQIEYRNGVCRLVLLQAKPFDAGQYTCQANNALGRTQTSASLQVPGPQNCSVGSAAPRMIALCMVVQITTNTDF